MFEEPPVHVRSPARPWKKPTLPAVIELLLWLKDKQIFSNEVSSKDTVLQMRGICYLLSIISKILSELVQQTNKQKQTEIELVLCTTEYKE